MEGSKLMKQASSPAVRRKQQESEREATVKALIELLEGGHAHTTFQAAVSDIPAKYRGVNPEGLPYSIWDLVVHIRIAQWDILEFSRNPRHHSPTWPEGYWPSDEMPPGEVDWQYNLKQIEKDKKEFISLLQDPANDLYKPFPHGDGQNLIREALLIADHTTYHVGQIIIVRRILGIW
jgi:hypothetical protein